MNDYISSIESSGNKSTLSDKILSESYKKTISYDEDQSITSKEVDARDDRIYTNNAIVVRKYRVYKRKGWFYGTNYSSR